MLSGTVSSAGCPITNSNMVYRVNDNTLLVYGGANLCAGNISNNSVTWASVVATGMKGSNRFDKANVFSDDYFYYYDSNSGYLGKVSISGLKNGTLNETSVTSHGCTSAYASNTLLLSDSLFASISHGTAETAYSRSIIPLKAAFISPTSNVKTEYSNYLYDNLNHASYTFRISDTAIGIILHYYFYYQTNYQGNTSTYYPFSNQYFTLYIVNSDGSYTVTQLPDAINFKTNTSNCEVNAGYCRCAFHYPYLFYTTFANAGILLNCYNINTGYYTNTNLTALWSKTFDFATYQPTFAIPCVLSDNRVAVVYGVNAKTSKITVRAKLFSY